MAAGSMRSALHFKGHQMRTGFKTVSLAFMLVLGASHSFAASAEENGVHRSNQAVQLGVRPFYIVDRMKDSELKTSLQECSDKRVFKKSEFSIGHRGAAMQFPEHTRESYVAAARMGAGIVECDVTFTADEELVCRHSQCDLHTTTNILATPLAGKCTVPPEFDIDGTLANAADITCCTSDITLAEFKTLKGTMDAFDPEATTVEEYMDATPSWRTDRYSGSGTVMSHKESIELFKELGVKMTPELKLPSVAMPFNGTLTLDKYRQKMIDEYKEAGVPASDVYPQSFNYADVLYWVQKEPEFGVQAVYLDGRYGETAEDSQKYPDFDPGSADTWEPLSMAQIKADGVNIIAPPMWVLVTLDNEKNIVPSLYAVEARVAGLDIITWTLERSGLLNEGGGWYYQGVADAIGSDGDTYEMLDVLASKVGVIGIFSDWPATVTYYANCKGIKQVQ
jgi:glycerophosphoryl diester phosphodiesterase